MGCYQAVEVNYDIQYKRHGIEQAAGSGATAEVRPCTDCRNHKLRAIKTIEKVDFWTRGHVLGEIQMLKAVSGQHPNIIQYVEFYEEWGVMNLIFEYCGKGTVEEALANHKVPRTEESIALFTHQLVDALAFLKSKSVLHRDVKPANLLLADERTAKLADFGVACYCTEPLRSFEGTPAFLPPEVHQLPKGKGYSFPRDIWAAGVTLYMLLFEGVHPFDDRGSVSKDLLRSGEFQVGWLTSSKVRDLLEWLLMPCPDQRITADEALQHAWFASYRFGAGGFAKERPHKLVLDSHGNWLRTN